MGELSVPCPDGAVLMRAMSELFGEISARGGRAKGAANKAAMAGMRRCEPLITLYVQDLPDPPDAPPRIIVVEV